MEDNKNLAGGLICRNCFLPFHIGIKRLLAAVFVLLCLTLFWNHAVYADETGSREVVKVGFFALNGYHMRAEDGTYSGYGYEFLRLAARYLDINYEYVGYEKSWEEMQQMLLDGEIDLLTSAQKTEERIALFDFSKPIGTSSLIVTVKNNNDLIIAQAYHTYDGMRVGMLYGNSRNDEFAQFAQEKGFSYEPVYFSGCDELAEALQNGQVDALVTSSLRRTQKERMIENFASREYYVMVQKGNAKLLNQINYAIDQLNATEGDWKNTLNNKYYSHLEAKNLEFTDLETEIIRQYASGEKTLTISCSVDRAPYSYVEDGMLKGIIPDYFQMLAEYAGLPYEVLIPSTRAELRQWQEEGTADVFIDGRLSSEQWVESHDSAISVPYITMRLAMVTRRDFDGTVRTLAVAENQGLSGIEEGLIKDAKQIMVSTREEGMQAVLDGKVDAAFVYLYTAQEFVNQDERGLLTYTALEEPVYEYQMVVTKDAPHALAGILSKCIYAMPSGTIENIASEYTSYKAADVNVLTWIRIYPVLSIMIFAVVFFMCLFAVLLYERQKAVKIEKQRSAELEKLNQQAQAANKAKSDFLTNISHDIRTPMNAIVGIADLLEHEEGLSDKLYTYVQKMQLSSQHMLSLINNVLDMSKIEADEVVLNYEAVDLAKQIEQIDSIIRLQTEAKGQNFFIRTHGIAQEAFVGDSIRLRQILLNLLGNAVKYTQRGGSIVMDITELACTIPNHAKLCFEITDNGCGMTTEFLQHLYEPFSRAEKSITNKVQGTGLGLTITKNIVDLMNGEISVESSVGKGTKFTVTLTLPMDKNPNDEIHADSILVFSADKDVRENLCSVFQKAGIRFLSAATEEEAEKLLKSSYITILLVADCFEKQILAAAIKRFKAAQKQLLIFCIDEAKEEQAILRQCGADGIISHPFFLSKLSRAVSLLRSSKQREEENASVLKGMRFLCAEDNSLNAEILEDILKVHGADCTIYPNGVEIVKAFEAVKPGEYQAILMDVQMPHMNGYEATKAIRAGRNPLGRTIPIIAMTANAFSEDVQQSLACGMDVHISKPLDIALLERTMEEFLKKEKT